MSCAAESRRVARMKTKWVEIVRHGHRQRVLVNAGGQVRFAKQDLPTRFWSKVKKTDGCWLWIAGKSPDGYGKFLLSKRETKRAHRVAWWLHHGAWPNPDLYLLHLCNEPLCVRPDHLREGTQAENIQQASREGRVKRGERNNRAALTEQQARDVLAAPATEGASSICRRLGIQSLAAVRQIRAGKTWKWLR